MLDDDDDDDDNDDDEDHDHDDHYHVFTRGLESLVALLLADTVKTSLALPSDA